MNTHLRLMSVSLAVLGGILSSLLTAAPAKTPAMVYRVNEVWHDGFNYVQPGVADTTVRFYFGDPTYQPTANVWIYHRFKANLDEANKFDCHNLVIVFNDQLRVKEIKLVNDEVVNVVMALAKTNPAALPNALHASND